MMRGVDTLTHGLLGLSIAALRRRDGSPTDRAAPLACVLAAELPDLDYLWPAADPVLATLRAHRGLSHSLIASPVVALAAAGLALAFVRWRRGRARLLPTWALAWLAVVAGHLLPDLWTGWGTRLLLPFSDARLALDWTMVIDPLVTLPLLAGALWAWRRRARGPLLAGLAVAALYVGSRAVTHAVLERRLAAAYPSGRVDAFPALLRPFTWRWVAALDGGYAAGTVGLTGAPREQARLPAGIPPREVVVSAPGVAEALAWARHPVITRAGEELRIADLRYHSGGRPTLTFVFAPGGARLDRGGSLRELLERWRGDGD
jgi:inner membrane protein